MGSTTRKPFTKRNASEEQKAMWIIVRLTGGTEGQKKDKVRIRMVSSERNLETVIRRSGQHTMFSNDGNSACIHHVLSTVALQKLRCEGFLL